MRNIYLKHRGKIYKKSEENSGKKKWLCGSGRKIVIKVQLTTAEEETGHGEVSKFQFICREKSE